MKKLTTLILVAIIMLSCNDYRRQMAEQIIELEEEVMADYNKEEAERLLSAYDKFIIKFPKDTTNKGFMLKAAEISILAENPESALKYLNMFLAQFPDDPRAGNAQYKKAIVYDLLVHDQIRAASEYETFIKNYPDHPSRAEAESALLLIRDPEAFTRMLMGSDSLRVDTIQSPENMGNNQP